MSEASDYQLKLWVTGTNIHNTQDNECCPDFSCCQNHYKAPDEERRLFLDRPELRDRLLMGFLACALSGMGKRVHIAGSTEGEA